MIQLLAIPALKDNYIWMLVLPHQQAIIVDPGDAVPVIHHLTQQQLTPIAILLTHHHADHTAGVKAIQNAYPAIEIYGPTEALPYGVNHLISGDSSIIVAQLTIQILAIPGHTLGHIAYYLSQGSPNPWLFCGDTLFSAGCGRLFEGSAQQLFYSLQRLTALPGNTLICCAHEYTLDNLRFACQIDPLNTALQHYQQQIIRLRKQAIPSLPTTLATQLLINPFLRCQQTSLQQQFGFQNSLTPALDLFTQLRHQKDYF